MNLAGESYVFAGVCLLDLLFTAWLVSTGRAVEGNPVMAYYLSRGWPALIAAKTTMVALPLFVIEWASRYHPVFARRMLRVGIGVYLGLYVAAVAGSDLVGLRHGSAKVPPPIGQASVGLGAPGEVVRTGDFSRR